MTNEPMRVSEDGSNSVTQHSSVTVLFEALFDPRRRSVLAYLREHGAESPETIAHELTDRETNGSGIEPAAMDYGGMRSELLDVHLPMLAAVGLIEHTADQKLVALTDQSMVLFDCVENASRCKRKPG